MGRMEAWRKGWENSCQKELKTTRKQMLRMKKKLEEQLNFIKELQRSVQHLELEKISGFADLRYFCLASDLCWLLWIRESSSQRRRHCGTAFSASQESRPTWAVISVVGRKKTAHFGHGNKTVNVMMYFKSVILLGQFVRLYTSQRVNSKTRILKIGQLGSNYQHLLEVYWTVSYLCVRIKRLKGAATAPSFI